jgi:hypothetical protein
MSLFPFGVNATFVIRSIEITLNYGEQPRRVDKRLHILRLRQRTSFHRRHGEVALHGMLFQSCSNVCLRRKPLVRIITNQYALQCAQRGETELAPTHDLHRSINV